MCQIWRYAVLVCVSDLRLSQFSSWGWPADTCYRYACFMVYILYAVCQSFDMLLRVNFIYCSYWPVRCAIFTIFYRVFLDARILRHCRIFQSNDPQNKIHCVQKDAISKFWVITTKFRLVTDLFTFCHFPKIYFHFILTGLLVLSISVAGQVIPFDFQSEAVSFLSGWRIFISMFGGDTV